MFQPGQAETKVDLNALEMKDSCVPEAVALNACLTGVK
ncbi:hypothetical protein N483_24260 [Pseudoalteromonas luteoviolacea NCIMB 1944]|uniref:Uncharacterized protein n=1 Tax=Pseudoalteromonas luteoviolacea (strain 2ta16) TaxID=1353533 RepID=V4HX15_PSEL2|nr:hypothetical protein PL2TA16_04308 [Pseudoalteromonas luteoviolacea 2ta16]KZN35059.1 hypothetical protein N483_24260 [Pseudoalteromonas luteoviolacea NCIMB 1944]